VCPPRKNIWNKLCRVWASKSLDRCN